MKGDDRQHRPAHALPAASKLEGVGNRCTAARDALIARARHAMVATRERLTRESPAPRIPELGTDLLVSPEPRWQWCLRTARTPAFGVAVSAYLVGACIFAGATSPSPTKGSTGDTDTDTDTGIIPRTALVAPDSPSGSGGTAGTNGLSPTFNIDAPFFDGMQNVVNRLGTQYIPAPISGPAADAPATAATPQPHLPELQTEPPTDGTTSDAPNAVTPRGPAPGPQSSASPNEPPAGAPNSGMPTAVTTQRPEPGPPSSAAAPADIETPVR